MRETLQQFIRPSGSFFNAGDQSRFVLVPDRDMIVLDRHELYRVQFIANVFRHIDYQFGEVLLQRDDKVVINVFFLFDYLMKLNARAFSLSSLERLDELAHIHRAPDLRRMLEKVVGESAELFFHRIPNGLYSYRFQSDLSMEIRYLSRLSEPEMAALNFTLDESQELKTTYSAVLEAAGEPNPDIISALGELYEFDQAYDVARGYYERAIRIIDADLERQVGEGLSRSDSMPEASHSIGSALHALAGTELFSGREGVIDLILRGNTIERRVLNYHMPWAVRRLRLMMQIGLTFEQVGDEERAQSQYYSAHMLARAITDVGFSRWHDQHDDSAPESSQDNTWHDGAWLSLLLENLPLIYQPLLSSAWVSEKLDGSIDTSLEMVEREIYDMIRRFEFVKTPDITMSNFQKKYFNEGIGVAKREPSQYNQNMALVAAEIHNKAGDLYFYKGRCKLSGSDETETLMKVTKPVKTSHLAVVQELKGYLPMARYHYCAALHEVRRFANFRRQLSQTAWNPTVGSIAHKSSTLRKFHWPSFTHLIAASSLIDLGELMRSGLTLSLVLRDIEDSVADVLDENDRRARLSAGKIAKYLPVNMVIDDLVKITDGLNELDLKKLLKLGDSFEKGNSKKKSGSKTISFEEIDGLVSRLKGEKQPPNILNDSYIRELDSYFDDWSEQPDSAINRLVDRPANHGRYIQAKYLGQWVNERLSTQDYRRIHLAFEPGRRDAIFLSLHFGIMGAEQTRRGGHALAAVNEYEIVLRHIARLLKNILVLIRLSQRPGSILKYTMTDRLEELIYLFCMSSTEVLQRITSLRIHHVPEGKQGYQIGRSVPVPFAVNLLTLEGTLLELVSMMDKSSRWFDKIDEHVRHLEEFLHPLFGEADHQDRYDCFYHGDDPSQLTRSRLLRMLDRHHFPVLAMMEARKTLIDMVLLSNDLNPHYYSLDSKSNVLEQRKDEAYVLLQNLDKQYKLVDAPMHFTPTKLAESFALTAIFSSNVRQSDIRRTVELLDEAEQSFSMGRKYYSNISRLFYLYDDFNDRSRHAEHAASMMQADLLAVFRSMLPV
ncbi:MAG: hypothetical protein AAF404_09420 [Pseudomonadota bacterium]